MEPAILASEVVVPPSRGSDAFVGRLRSFWVIVAQLLLILAVVYLWEIEARRNFFVVMAVVVGGFLVHAWLPPRLRPAFFAMLSIGTILLVLGLVTGACVLAIGSGLIAICYLPIRFWLRVALLAIVGAGLVFARQQHSSLRFWPVLGSMFMFRLIIYLYDIRHERERMPLLPSLSYFFLLPNVCFPLFPVVDYRTFRENYCGRDEWSIYQRGVTWIVRGINHLLLYRYIKFYLVPAPYELTNLAQVALFMAANYGLYLRVSGQFHLITGILHLFGFHLPRTHNLYFLASSLSDIWRRINIYWKDFMMKVFFFPTFFALRNRGVSTGAAASGAVMFVFVCTWLLHSWQMYWLRGVFPLSARVAALWLLVGALVAVNSWLEYRTLTRPVKTKARPWLYRAIGVSLQTIGTFALVSLFWACWTRPGFEETLWELLPRIPASVVDMGLAIAAVAALVAAGVAVQWLRLLYPAARLELDSLIPRQSMRFNALLLAALVTAGLPGFARMFDSRTAQAIVEFRSDSLTPLELASQMHGYYEELNDAVSQAGPFLSSLNFEHGPPNLPGSEYSKLVRRADPQLESELIPGVRGEVAGSRVSINQFGMRDRETVSLGKPSNAVRIALVGSSVVMGYGVHDDEVFGRLLEAKLNAGRSHRTKHYEILNFGIGRHDAIRRHVLIDRKVLAFEPDAIYYFAHQDELLAPIPHMVNLISEKYELPYPSLRTIVQRAGITPEMAGGAIELRLRPYSDEIVLEMYRSIVTNCRRRGIVPVWIYLPIPGVRDAPDHADRIRAVAQESGFEVLDLTDWTQGLKPLDVKRAVDDYHPDGRGHRRIVEVLYQTLLSRPGALPIVE